LMRAIAVLIVALVVSTFARDIAPPSLSRKAREGYRLGFERGSAMAREHSTRMAAEHDDPISFLEMAESLSPLFDEYDASAGVQSHGHHHRHAHGTRPSPADDVEEDFLADYTKTEVAAGTRPSSPRLGAPKSTPKSLAAMSLAPGHTMVKTQLKAALTTRQEDELAADPTEGKNQTVASAEGSARLEEQQRRIEELEDNYKRAQARLERYESQQSAMGAGSGQTDSAGKTEFIKGYEGGFKVGYEAGWNMATADLKKRYGFPERTGHNEETAPPATNITSLNNVTAATASLPPAATPAPVPEAPPAAPAQDTPAAAMNLNHMFNGMVDNAKGAMRNNPFFPDMQEPEMPQPQMQQQDQQQAMQFGGALQPMMQQQQQQPQFMPQQMQGGLGAAFGGMQGGDSNMMQQQIPQLMQQMQQMQQMQPQQQMDPNQMGLFQPQMQLQAPQQQFAPVQNKAPEPQGLPGKAFQFLSNVKNMIQEGRNTVDAVKAALTDEPQAQQQQQQFPQMMMQQQQPQQMFMQQPQQPQQQASNPFGAFQSLMQTAPAESQPQASGNDMLGALAGLLGGNSGQQQPQGDMSNQLGLQNLAQLLATTTGTASAAKPKPVQGGGDSTALGLQEMQNMIQEGQQ